MFKSIKSWSEKNIFIQHEYLILCCKKTRFCRLSRFQRSTAITDTVLNYLRSIEGRTMKNNCIFWKKRLKQSNQGMHWQARFHFLGMVIEDVECRSKYFFQERVVCMIDNNDFTKWNRYMYEFLMVQKTLSQFTFWFDL